MRQLTVLPQEEAAQRLADYLLTQQITTRVDRLSAADGGWEVWVREEEQVAQAREILAEFEAAPDDEKFVAAHRTAKQLRTHNARREAEYRRNVIDVRRKWYTAGGPAPLTMALIGLSVLVSILMQFGESESTHWIYYAAPPNLIPLGEPWRFITPIFLHWSMFHLVMNMFFMWTFGRIVEWRIGPGRLLALVLLVAVTSNTAQALVVGPIFGGMSGVGCGLFGYIWMQSRFEPLSGLRLSQGTVLFMLAFLLLCTTGVFGPIANWAHGVGLGVGMAVGIAPTLWRKLRS